MHSPEPWTLETGINYQNTPDAERWVQVIGPNRELVLYDCAKGTEGDKILATLTRIVACVNFCQHLPTDTLQRLTASQIGPATILAMLPRLEFILEEEGTFWCPWCQTLEPNHAEDCLLKRALDAVLAGWPKVKDYL